MKSAANEYLDQQMKVHSQLSIHYVKTGRNEVVPQSVKLNLGCIVRGKKSRLKVL